MIQTQCFQNRGPTLTLKDFETLTPILRFSFNNKSLERFLLRGRVVTRSDRSEHSHISAKSESQTLEFRETRFVKSHRRIVSERTVNDATRSRRKTRSFRNSDGRSRRNFRDVRNPNHLRRKRSCRKRICRERICGKTNVSRSEETVKENDILTV